MDMYEWMETEVEGLLRDLRTNRAAEQLPPQKQNHSSNSLLRNHPISSVTYVCSLVLEHCIRWGGEKKFKDM